MRLIDVLERWSLTSLKIKTPFLEAAWEPKDADKTAAWELYVELITRAATQRLDPEEGDEVAALTSIYELFPLTRETIKRNGRNCITFTRIAWSSSTRGSAGSPRGGTPEPSLAPSMLPPASSSGRTCVTCRQISAITHVYWPTWPMSRI